MVAIKAQKLLWPFTVKFCFCSMYYIKVVRSSTLSVYCIVTAQILIVSQSFSQYGASPSQTGLFFDDLRLRQNNERATTQAGTRDGDVSYDYGAGVYRSGHDSIMGQRSPDFESARNLARPSVRSGSSAFAARSVGDYTNYSGQYSSPTGFFAPTYTSDPFLSGRRNLKLGPINVGFGLYQGLEYNDNVNRSGTAPVGDTISTTMLSIDANYQITQNNRLSLSTALGFDRYLENPDLAPYSNSGFVLNVLPGSTIAFDIKVGPAFFTIYNRFSVRPAARNDSALSQNQTFGVFQNDSGIASNWQVNSDWTLATNYMHSSTNSLSTGNNAANGGFEEFNRTTDSLHASLSYSPSKTWATGIEGGSSITNYESSFNADGALNNTGAFLVLPIGKTTYLRASAGVQIFEFDSLTPPIIFGPPGIGTPNQSTSNSGDQSDLNDFYYSLTLSNRLNARISQSLTVGHESALNLTSNFVTADFVNYGVTFVAWKGSRITVSGYQEDAKASGGTFAQNFFQYGGDIYIAHRLTSHLQFGAGHHYGFSDPEAQQQATNATSNEFVQQAYNVDLTYVLSAKAKFNLGYRYFTTKVDIATGQDFNQNRIVLGFNYNF